jgi:predicted amidohydrolase
MTRFVAGCVQVCPGDDRGENIARAAHAIAAAAQAGATLIVLPEYVSFLHASGKVMRSSAVPEAEDPALARFRQLAIEHSVWLVIGSLVLASEHGKAVNRSFVIANDGRIVAHYDKLHMFDVTLPNGRVIQESSSYAPGDRAVVVDTPFGRLGMSICYDVRFPQLYRALAQAGAEILLVPAAFTQATGAMHWQALMRARAIENGAYVLAAATCGMHPGGHQTYGHAMIVDPAGVVIAKAEDRPEVVCAEIDLAVVTQTRARLPSLLHDRAFELTVTD